MHSISATLILLAFAVFAAPIHARPGPPTAKLEIVLPPSAAVGDVVTAEIVVDLSGATLGAYSLDLSCDPGVLEIVDILGGATLEFSSPPTRSWADCEASFNAFQTQGAPTGRVSVARAQIRVLGDTRATRTTICSSSRSLFDSETRRIGDPDPACEDLTVVPTPEPLDFYPVTPCRVLNTLGAEGPAIQAGNERVFGIRGRCQIPATARAISGVISVVRPSEPGFVTAFPADELLPVVSAVNFRAGGVTNNNLFLKLASGGSGDIRIFSPTGVLDLILDVNGYFE